MKWTKLYIMIAIGMMAACTQSPSPSANADKIPYYNSADFTPIWLEQGDAKLKDLHQIPSFNLQNQLGETITEETFKDKIYVTDFFFTICPGICPKMTENMAYLQDVFKEDDEVLLLSHSVMPSVDSVGQLMRYADSKGCINGKWHLATGEQAHIYTLGRKAYFVEEDLGVERTVDEFLHTENFILVDQNRHIRGIYNGLNQTEINKLIEDIRVLKKS